ncbi:MAG: ATP-grasp domain-containing protein [Bacteroidia bacterium]
MTHFLFPSHPFDANLCEPDFLPEYEMVQELGGTPLLVNEALLRRGNFVGACRRLPKAETLTPIMYRGWMLKPSLYQGLFEALEMKNYALIHDVEAYLTCHYFPKYYPLIEKYTPFSVVFPLNEGWQWEELYENLRVFGEKAMIVKDYVKSEKHHWETACFMENAADKKKVKSTVENFLALRGTELNEGLVFRTFEQFQPIGTHEKSGMPLTHEYRLFFYEKKLIAASPYWEGSDVTGLELPDTQIFEAVAQQLPARFFSLDIAQKTDKTWCIVEIGEGQMAGLPEQLDLHAFYSSIVQ